MSDFHPPIDDPDDKGPHLNAVNANVKRLRERCFLSESPSQMSYEEVLQDLADLRAFKVAQYGEAAYEGTDPEEDMRDRFQDIKRKFLRLETLTHHLVKLGMVDGTTLKLITDCYRDLANYGVMGVQVLERHYGKQPLDLS